MNNLNKIVYTLIVKTLIFSLGSCGKSDDDDNHKRLFFEESYVNSSDYNLKINVYNSQFQPKEKVYHLSIDDILTLKREQFISTDNYESGVVPIKNADSLVISYGDKKACFSNDNNDDKFDIRNLANYSLIKKSESQSNYIYTFTNEDYINANNCN